MIPEPLLAQEHELARWRRDVPALALRVHDHPLTYLDNAATTLKPQAVIDAVTQVALAQAGNVHRGVHALAEAATEAFDAVRPQVARFLGASADEVIFTSGATASINLVAHSLGRQVVGPGDAIVVTELEHHANLVPWQLLCAERGAELRVVAILEDGRISLEDLARKLDRRVKLVALCHLSNVLGTVAPVAEVAAMAHAVGALVLVDGAQAVAHLAPAELAVSRLGCDFYVFSAHKVFGPTGTGVLWGRRELLAQMPPWQTGGEMIASVDYQRAQFRPPPERFEAGTPNISGVIGLGAALRYLASLPAHRAAHEAALHRELCAAVAGAPGVTILGRPQAAVVSFVVARAHPHDVATLLDQRGVAVRAGHHCAQPLHGRLGVSASCRASLAYYNSLEDVRALAAALSAVREVFP
ncbi:MAG TPA: SufS family cysteine desulfurase [Kofleriaceae bacterium]|nr:SufS family cysteine desulfurase [Kofleriaceae bacterium]